jgi:hypothetical protein
VKDALDRVDQAFCDVMEILEKEESANGRSVDENQFLRRFRNWRSELAQLRDCPADDLVSEPSGPAAGGMFID